MKSSITDKKEIIMSTRHHAPSIEALNASVKVNPAGSLLYLRDRQHVNMQDAAGWTVKALTGSVWITQEGDNRDIALNAGESFTVDRDGSTLVSPFGEARICVSHAPVRNPKQNRAIELPASLLTGFRLAA
jgi:hypothetical protein